MLQVALCDSWLDWGGRLVPLQSSACARSSVLDMALRQAAKRGPGGGPVLTLDSSQLDSLRACVGRLTPLALERFLAALAGAALEKHCSEVGGSNRDGKISLFSWLAFFVLTANHD